MTDQHHTIPELDAKGLREFALVTGSIVAVLFGLFFPWLLDLPWPLWPWILAGVLVIWGLVAPASLRPVYRMWMRFGLLMNRIVTPVLLGAIFFLIITPVGLIRRMSSRAPVARSFEQAADSYRIPSRKQPREKMEKPF